MPRPPKESAMSSLTECQRNSASPGSRAAAWLAGISGVLWQVWDFLERAAAGRRALRQLANADDRMLRDIGLDRSALRDAAAEPFYRDPTSLLAGRVQEACPRNGRRFPRRYY
jgi:uncharacterized protein YjiS (DUF1127 family)